MGRFYSEILSVLCSSMWTLFGMNNWKILMSQTRVEALGPTSVSSELTLPGGCCIYTKLCMYSGSLRPRGFVDRKQFHIELRLFDKKVTEKKSNDNNVYQKRSHKYENEVEELIN